MTDELGFKLDQLVYDWLVLGTGYQESLYAAHLTKLAKQSVLVIDISNSYSSYGKTMNFKELQQLPKELQLSETIGYKKHPSIQHIPNKYQELNDIFAKSINAGHDFKFFNIDMQPKLLYSTSPTVDILQQADMDQYMDFKAIEAQYFYDDQSKVFQLAPTSKSQIFTCKFLSLYEKKQLFSLLHTLIKIYNKITNFQVDQNSINDFDQNNTIDEQSLAIYNRYKNEKAIDFIDNLLPLKAGQKQRIISILFYSICFTSYGYESEQSMKTDEFVIKMGKYIRSLGVHSQSAFLYTNYGTGDIAQGLCRLAAVNGATYILNDKLKLSSINPQEQGFLVQTNLNEQPLTINQGIITMTEIYESMRQEQPTKNVQKLLRLVIITTKNLSKVSQDVVNLIGQEPTEDNKQYDHPPNPSIYVIPCKVMSQHPIYIFRTDNRSNSTHSDYEVFYIKTLLQEQDPQSLIQLLTNFTAKIDYARSTNDYQSHNHICYVESLIQSKNLENYPFQPLEQENLYVCGQDTFELDFDEQTIHVQKNMKQVSEAVEDGFYLIKNPEKNGIPQNKIDEKSEDQVWNLLEQINTIKLSNQQPDKQVQNDI